MPRITVVYVRASLLYLGLGITFGALMLANKGVPFAPELWRLLGAHTDIMLVGWVIQLAMGVAAWIVPRFNREPRYGVLPLAWAAWAMLNTGVILASIGAWFGLGLILPGRVLVAGAAVVFALYLWKRVKPAEFAPAPARE